MAWLSDTHVLLWALEEPDRLPEQRQNTLADTADTVYFSAVNIWEIAIKISLGCRNFGFSPERVQQLAEQAGFIELPVAALHAAKVAHLPLHHRDPFDRLLVAQAITEQVRLLTADEALPVYSQLVECFRPQRRDS